MATKLVRYIPTQNRAPIVADFTCGNGALLKAAAARYPSGTFLGVDIDPNNIKRLRRSSPEWHLFIADFLDSRSIGRHQQLAAICGKVDAICLNPPFSCRGAAYHDAEWNGETLKCGKALAFLFKALPYLSRNGVAIAILPSGSVTSQRDRDAWDALHRAFVVKIHFNNSSKLFRNCSAHTVVVSLKQRQRVARRKSVYVGTTARKASIQNVEVFRGTFNVANSSKERLFKSVHVIHTTEIHRDSIRLSSRRAPLANGNKVGFVVLIPRVGNPRTVKCGLYLRSEPIALSSCLIALKCPSKTSARTLQRHLLRNWDIVASYYHGTGAQFVTLEDVSKMLQFFGYAAVQKVHMAK